MKGLVAFLAAFLLFTSAALAAPALPDYKNQRVSVPGKAYACDKETTRIQRYIASDSQWNITEVSTASGDTFVDYGSAGAWNFYVQPAGSSEMKNVSHEEFDKVLKEKSVAVYNMFHGGPTDCVPAFSIQGGK